MSPETWVAGAVGTATAPAGTATAPAGTATAPAAAAAPGAAAAFRLAPLAPAGRSAREQERSIGYAAGWAAGARAAAEQAERLRTALAAQHQVAEARRDADLTGALQVLARAAAAADARTAPVVASAREAMIAGALALAEAVLGHELRDGEDRARAALARALAVPADLGLHTVRLSRPDHEVLVAAGVQPPDGVALVADSRLVLGDAVSEHAAGYLDAQLGTALDRARRALGGADR